MGCYPARWEKLAASKGVSRSLLHTGIDQSEGWVEKTFKYRGTALCIQGGFWEIQGDKNRQENIWKTSTHPYYVSLQCSVHVEKAFDQMLPKSTLGTMIIPCHAPKPYLNPCAYLNLKEWFCCWQHLAQGGINVKGGAAGASSSRKKKATNCSVLCAYVFLQNIQGCIMHPSRWKGWAVGGTRASFQQSLSPSPSLIWGHQAMALNKWK